jgi:hypothetical protein
MKFYIDLIKRERHIVICNVIFMLMERKKYLNSFNRKVAIRKGGRYIL